MYGFLTASVIRVQTFENGPPIVIFTEVDATRDMSEGADQWALGVLAFQVLGGRLPKPNETLSAPNAADRLTAAGAQRQFLDLAENPEARAAAPLAAMPQIKRGIPIGIQKTDAHAWVQRQDGTKPVPPAAARSATKSIPPTS